VLGRSKRLFGDGLAESPLTLVEARQTGEVVALTLVPKR